MNMKKIYITLVSFTAAVSAFAGQRDTLAIESGLDTISLGYGIEVLANMLYDLETKHKIHTS